MTFTVEHERSRISPNIMELKRTRLDEKYSSAAAIPLHVREYERVRWAMVTDDEDEDIRPERTAIDGRTPPHDGFEHDPGPKPRYEFEAKWEDVPAPPWNGKLESEFQSLVKDTQLNEDKRFRLSELEDARLDHELSKSNYNISYLFVGLTCRHCGVNISRYAAENRTYRTTDYHWYLRCPYCKSVTWLRKPQGKQ